MYMNDENNVTVVYISNDRKTIQNFFLVSYIRKSLRLRQINYVNLGIQYNYDIFIRNF